MNKNNTQQKTLKPVFEIQKVKLNGKEIPTSDIRYCSECGEVKKPKETGKFNTITGAKETRLVCFNLKCQDGCGEITGHSNWSCWRNKCLNCGYKQTDY